MEIAGYVVDATARRYVGGKGAESVQAVRRRNYKAAAKAVAKGLAIAGAVYLAPAVGGALQLAGDFIPAAILHNMAVAREDREVREGVPLHEGNRTMRELDEYVGNIRDSPPRSLGFIGGLAARALRGTLQRHQVPGLEQSAVALLDYAQGGTLRGPGRRGGGRQLVGVNQ